MCNRQIKNSNRMRSAHKGLTLIELLVAISILGLVAVLGWRGLDSIVRARIALTTDLEQTRGMQLAFAQLQSDCAHMANSTMLPNREPLIMDQGRLSLVRTVFADNLPTRLQVITYRITNGVLTRQESGATRDLRELDKLWLTAANDADPAQTVALKSGVSAMTMRLWDGSSWQAANLNAPMPAAPVIPIVNPVLPTGLEVALQLQGRNSSMLKIFMLGAV